MTEQSPTTLCGNTTTEYIFNFVPQIVAVEGTSPHTKPASTSNWQHVCLLQFNFPYIAESQSADSRLQCKQPLAEMYKLLWKERILHIHNSRLQHAIAKFIPQLLTIKPTEKNMSAPSNLLQYRHQHKLLNTAIATKHASVIMMQKLNSHLCNKKYLLWNLRFSK